MRIIAMLTSGLYLVGNLTAQIPITHERQNSNEEAFTAFFSGCFFDLGPDITVCNNAVFNLNPHPEPGVQYNWIGESLSCYDCPTPQVSGLSTGQYAYIGMYVGPNCTLFDTVIVTVIAGQAPQYTLAPSQAICSGESVSLGGPPQPGTTYFWFSLPPGFTTSVSNPVVSPAVHTRFFLFVNSASCPITTTDSVSIDVFPLPGVNLIADTVVCQGEPVSLSNDIPQTGVNYQWSPNDGSLDNPQTVNPIATPDVSTNYTLIASNPGCADTQTVSINVVPIGISSPNPDSMAVCRGESITLDLVVQPAGLPVAWSPAGGLEILPGGLSALATPEISVLYTARVENGGCVRTESFYIHVDSLPANTGLSPADTTICAGAEVLLTAPAFDPGHFPGISFSWMPQAGQVGPDSLASLLVQPFDTVTYRRITRLGVCLDTLNAVVNVLPVVQISITPSDTSVCPGSPVALQVDVPVGVENFSWAPDTGLSCNDCSNPVATVADTTVFTLTGWIAGCAIQAETRVNIRPFPAFQFPDVLQLCLGDTLLLNALSDTLSSYTWTSTDTAFGVVSDPMPLVAPKASAVYYLQADNGCVLDTALAVTVSHATLSVSGDTTICRNRSVKLTAEGTLPGTYAWSSGQTGQAITVSPVETTLFVVTYTYGGVCQITDTVIVTIAGEAPKFETPEDKAICPGESILLNSLIVPGASYVWTSLPAGFYSTQATPVVSPLESTSYLVTATLGNCVNSAQVDVTTSNPILQVNPDTSICEGEPILLQAWANAGNGTFEWTPGGPGQEWLDYPVENTAYILEYRFGDDCLLTDTVEVSLIPGFDLDIISAPDSNRLEVGTPLLLTAVVQPDQGIGGFTFNWRENDLQDVGSGPELEFPLSTNDTTIFFVLTAVSPSGCIEKSLISFTVVQPRVVVPNAFTPDGDGINDSFGLVTLEGKTSLELLQVYNRWGQLIFSTAAPQGRWDGMANGEAAPSDVYYYVLRWRRADGALMPAETGDILLIR